MRNLITLAFAVSAFVACSSSSDDSPAPITSDASSIDSAVQSEAGTSDDAAVATDSSVATDSGVTTDASNADAATGLKRVFVSSKTYTGDLKTAGAGVTGADGANKLCNSLAMAAGLSGTWKAWVSVGGTKAASRLTDVGGWHLMEPGGAAGGVVFANLAATTGSATIAINHNESGADVGAGYPVWTGTLANGNVGETCADWSSAMGVNTGTRGAGNGTVTWTENNTPAPCDEKKAIYCFEQ